MTNSAPRRIPWWAFLPYLLLSAVHVVALAVGAASVAAPTKIGLMPLLAFAVVMCARGVRATAGLTLLLVAILLSWLGDSVGSLLPFLPQLPAMLVFFGIAHLAYMLLFWRHLAIRRVAVWALVYALWWIAMVVFVAPHAGDLAVAVAIYGVVLAGTAVLATRATRIVAIGAAFFLASDSLLAFLLFLPDAPGWLDPAVMTTYTLGQGLIAAGAVVLLRRGARNRAQDPRATEDDDALSRDER